MKNTYFWRICLGFVLSSMTQLVVAQDSTIMNQTSKDDVVLTKERFEGFNRGAYQFNDGWDQVAFKPISQAYEKIVPPNARGCIHGIFENMSVPYTSVNNILQGKFKAAGQDLCRFIVNTTVGLGGCIDVASKWNIPKHDEDFGQTLGVWGVPAGPYLMIPGLGPSTVRDALAKPADFFANPIGYLKLIKLRNALTGLRFVDTRTELLRTTDLADDIAFDKYALLRDTWLQRREALVNDVDYEPDVAPLSDNTVAPPIPAINDTTAPVDSVKVSAETSTDVLAPLSLSVPADTVDPTATTSLQ